MLFYQREIFMIKDVIKINSKPYPYLINNNGEIFVGERLKNSHYKVDIKGKVSYYGRHVSDFLDYNTWVAIITKTLR